MGRIECADNQVSVYRDGVKTFETTRPHARSSMFRFPQDIEPLSMPEPGVKTFGPREFEAVWKDTRYADLFNETLRTDGWMTEQMAVVLMERFVEDPRGFVRALAVAPSKETDLVSGLLAYVAGDPEGYRQQISELRKDFPTGKESQLLDRLSGSLVKAK